MTDAGCTNLRLETLSIEPTYRATPAIANAIATGSRCLRSGSMVSDGRWVMRDLHRVPFDPKGQRIPAQGATLGMERWAWTRGTDWWVWTHRYGTGDRYGTGGQCDDPRRSVRMRMYSSHDTQGVALGWYALPRWGRNWSRASP